VKPLQYTYSHPILILSSHKRLVVASGAFPSNLLPNCEYITHTLVICAKCPDHLILLHFVTITILHEGYKLRSSWLCSFFFLLTYRVSLMALSFYVNVFKSTRFKATTICEPRAQLWSTNMKSTETDPWNRNSMKAAKWEEWFCDRTSHVKARHSQYKRQ